MLSHGNETSAEETGDQVVGHLKMRVTLARPLTDRMKEVRNQRKRAEQEGFFPGAGGAMGMGMGAMGMGMGAMGMGMGMGGYGGAGMGYGGSGGGHFGSGGGGGRGRGARGAGGWPKGGFQQQQQQQGSYWDPSSYGGMSGMSMGGMFANPFGGFATKPSRPPRGG